VRVQGHDYAQAMAARREAGEPGDEVFDGYADRGRKEATFPVGINRMLDGYYSVRFSDRTSSPAGRDYLLKHGWKKCGCCKGYGLVEE
jgi:hypothetical protein